RIRKHFTSEYPLPRKHLVRVVVRNPAIGFETERLGEGNVEVSNFARDPALEQSSLERADANLRAFHTTKGHYDEEHITHKNTSRRSYRVGITNVARQNLYRQEKSYSVALKPWQMCKIRNGCYVTSDTFHAGVRRRAPYDGKL